MVVLLVTLDGSQCKFLLIMSNCSGHDASELPSNVTIAFLPLRSTAKYQHLNVGLIGHSKICHRSLLLRLSIEIILKLHEAFNRFKLSSGKMKWGLQDGKVPYVDNATMLFVESWRKIELSTILSF